MLIKYQLLNYDRPHNLEKSLPIINNYNLIDEIIVAHGHQKYYKEFKFSKVKNVKDFKNNEYMDVVEDGF
tara:strand:- start:736 stop:945 length:210 start_codon:yes stop_codon:yes gene_type:complete